MPLLFKANEFPTAVGASLSTQLFPKSDDSNNIFFAAITIRPSEYTPPEVNTPGSLSTAVGVWALQSIPLFDENITLEFAAITSLFESIINQSGKCQIGFT